MCCLPLNSSVGIYGSQAAMLPPMIAEPRNRVSNYTQQRMLPNGVALLPGACEVVLQDPVDDAGERL